MRYRLKLPRCVRFNPLFLGAYLLIVGLTILLLLHWGGKGEPEAVTAFAFKGGSQQSTFQSGQPFELFLFKASVLKAILRSGMPLLNLVPDPAGGSSFSARKIVDLAVTAATDIRANDPASFLRSQIPLLSRFYRRNDIHISQSEPEEGETAAAPDQLPVVSRIGMPLEAKGKPLIGIYHTHARESYLPAMDLPETSNPDEAHTTDLSKTVVALGAELASLLQDQYGIPVVHSKEMHDREGKAGAYGKSLVTAQEMLRQYPSIRVLLDIHRDSQRRNATVTNVKGQTVSRVLIVLGTDKRFEHPHWRKNLEFAAKVVRVAQEKYPGLILGIYPKMDRFNQHLLPGALLLEIGGVDNTMEENKRSIQMLADIFAELVAKGEIP